MVNRVFMVERFIYKVTEEEYKPSEEEVKSISELLGQPTKKLSVLLDRYRQVFGKYIEKRCVNLDNTSICIYTWNQRVSFKVFPLSLHSVGTVLLFKNGEPVEVLAYPIPKALSYARSSDVPEDRYGSIVPKEVTKRIDGWQIIAYYNPILKGWTLATRYVLHNMYFERGKLMIEPIDTIANPFVYVADKLAQEENLYSLLDRFRGWTFTFVLQGPEPAITKPPHPLGEDYSRYGLFVLMARDTSGKLYTWRDTVKLLGYRGAEHIEPKPLSELYSDVVKRLDVRSYIAYINTDDEENPLLLELESNVYQDAMYVKYLYDAKSAALLVTDDLTNELVKIVDQSTAKILLDMSKDIKDLKMLLEGMSIEMTSAISWEILRTLSEFREDVDVRVEEISKALREKNVNRVVRKLLSLLLENRSLIAKDTQEILKIFIERLKQRLGHVEGKVTEPS